MVICSVVVGAACQGAEGQDEKAGSGSGSGSSSSEATPPPPPPEPRTAAPHGGTISLLAISDAATAAITVDDLRSARVWPRLDGSAPPVPIRVPAATAEVAIDRTREGLLVALRDAAGGALVMRLTPAGAELGRAQLPDTARYRQILVVGETVLALRTDQSLARFDSRGVPRGELAGAGGEQLATLTARHGMVVALAGDTDRGFATLHEVDLTGEGLRWGRTIALPRPLLAPVALSPSHHRFAGRSALTAEIEVIDLATLAVMHGPDPPLVPQTEHVTLGFVDDDHLAVGTGALAWWTPPTPKGTVDPWERLRAPSVSYVTTLPVAVGDGVFAIPAGESLELSDYRNSRWLGYRMTPDAVVRADGSGQFVIGPIDDQVVWLDTALQQTRTFPMPPRSNANVVPYVLDAKHLIVYRQGNKPVIDFYDADKPDAPIYEKAFDNVLSVFVDPERHVVVVVELSRAERFRFDPVTEQVEALAPIEISGQVDRVFVTDPARADGVAAIAMVSREDDGLTRVYEYLERTGSAAAQVTAPIKRIDRGNFVPAFASVDGTTYETTPNELVLHRGATQQKPVTWSEAEVGGLTAISHDGQTFMSFQVTKHEVVATDARGAVRWRAPAWSTGSAVFSSDDRVVAIATTEGLTTYDVATGRRIAARCGWQFGLWTKEIQARVFGVEPACAE